eukprot:TRINITY_DN1176_c0_g1_i43.p1 TRINITY_DN1176_c0_g1~~TRINITY_DN1176_c0_g1_i43.p1  ORF type:complete len:110 (+),score=19.37 TRINITY_DN1176_c0_g1_i43:140-469(+)
MSSGRRGGASSTGKVASSKPSSPPTTSATSVATGDRDGETKEKEPPLQFALRTDYIATIISAPPPLSSLAADLGKMKKDREDEDTEENEEIGRAVQQECRDRSRMPSSA